MNSNIWLIQTELLPINSIIRYDCAVTTYANQELVTFTMCVLSPCFYTWHVKYHEIAFRGKRNTSIEFANSQASTNIWYSRHAMQVYTCNAGYGDPYFSLLRPHFEHVSARGIHITHNFGWISHDYGVGRNRPGDYGSCRYHSLAANNHTRKNHCTRANRGSLVNGGNEKFFRFLLTSWKSIIGK